MKSHTWSQSMRWVVACLFATQLVSPAFAVDKGVYQGEWSTNAPSLSLKITGQDASFMVDGKTYTDPTPEYFYGQQGIYPFLYLQADEAANDPAYEQNEHRLYLIIGETSTDALSLRGYYDYSRIRKDHHGTVENTSYPIQMERIGDAPNVQVPPIKGQPKS